MLAHRRCITKVGNYCGCEKTVLALYEKWKETVNIDVTRKTFYFFFSLKSSICDETFSVKKKSMIRINTMVIFMQFIRRWIISRGRSMQNQRFKEFHIIIIRISLKVSISISIAFCVRWDVEWMDLWVFKLKNFFYSFYLENRPTDKDLTVSQIYSLSDELNRTILSLLTKDNQIVT